MKEFLEDYDDLRDDPKYYKGSALARRMKARDLEAADDNRDRQKEKEEMEDLKAKLKEEGHGDDSEEIIRLDETLSSHLRPMLHLATAGGTTGPIDEGGMCEATLRDGLRFIDIITLKIMNSFGRLRSCLI